MSVLVRLHLNRKQRRWRAWRAPSSRPLRPRRAPSARPLRSRRAPGPRPGGKINVIPREFIEKIKKSLNSTGFSIKRDTNKSIIFCRRCAASLLIKSYVFIKFNEMQLRPK